MKSPIEKMGGSAHRSMKMDEKVMVFFCWMLLMGIIYIYMYGYTMICMVIAPHSINLYKSDRFDDIYIYMHIYIYICSIYIYIIIYIYAGYAVKEGKKHAGPQPQNQRKQGCPCCEVEL